jgi:DNA-binding SARP family transcriptional activator
MSDSTVTLSLLRGFALQIGDQAVPFTGSAQRVVAFLALKDRPLHRAHVAGTLWPETTSIRANANLRSALWRVHRSCPRLVVASAQQLALDPDVEVDIRTVAALAHRLLDSQDPCDFALDKDIRSDLAADLLPDWDEDDWVLVEQEQFHQLRLHALEAMCRRLTAIGRHGEAVAAGLAAIRAEPLRESAHETLILAHLAEGNRSEAMRQYVRCRGLLMDELGVEPSSALRDLISTGQLLPRQAARRLAAERSGLHAERGRVNGQAQGRPPTPEYNHAVVSRQRVDGVHPGPVVDRERVDSRPLKEPWTQP